MVTATNSATVASLMARFRGGDPSAAGELVELLYPELRRLAAERMRRERPEHSWQPTVLINELYLELVKIRALRASGPGGEEERKAFLGLAAHLMKRLLTHHARPLSKRATREELPVLPEPGKTDPDGLAQVEQILDRLRSIDPKLRTVVELRVFEGLTGNEIAERMNCGTATVTRYWRFARRWLADQLGETPGS